MKQSSDLSYPRTPGPIISSRNSRSNCSLSSDHIGHRNRLNYAVRSYIHQHQSIENFDDRDLEEIILSKNALKIGDSKKLEHLENITSNQQRVNMVDLEVALSYMLRREIPRLKEIQGETYDALVHWLLVLTKVGFALIAACHARICFSTFRVENQ